MTFYEEDYEYYEQEMCGCMLYWLEEPDWDDEEMPEPDKKLFCHNHAMMEKADMEHDNTKED